MTRHETRRRSSGIPTYRPGMLVCLRESIVPDLWRVSDVEGRIATLEPVTLGATGRQVPVSDLRRYRLKTTDQVFYREDLVRVFRVNNPRAEELYEYTVEREGMPLTLRESELTVHVGSAAPDPLSLLKNLDAAPAPLALARANLLQSYFKATARSLGIVGYNGARMLPIPHQVSAARYVLLHGRPRFLLADEVGLGKTVEAGLIVSTLRKYFPEWRTVFFVPESLSVQWAFEMYAKFDKSIFRLSDEEEPEEGEDDSGVILPHSRAAEWCRESALGQEGPEILVIDEAHQMLRDPDQYEACLALSRKAHAVLLLTATPTADDRNSLYRLLRLCDPEHFGRFDRPESLAALFRKQPAVEALLKELRTGGDAAAVEAAWNAIGLDDEELTARVLSLKVDPTDRIARHRIAALVIDRAYPRARILRYQRKFLAMDNEMAERVEESVEYDASKQEKRAHKLVRQWLDLVRDTGHGDRTEWRQAAMTLIQASNSSPLALAHWLDARMGRLADAEGVSADPVRLRRDVLAGLEFLDGEETLLDELGFAATDWRREARAVDMKGRALARLPRYEELLRRIREHLEFDEPQRILIFTSFECNVRPLYLLLNKALGENVDAFFLSAEVEWREREKAAFGFQEATGHSVLVSDELGGEGRNFQFASTIFHFDTPIAPWILEQRIGRLDRVGREPDLDVDSQVLVAPGELDEAVYEFHRDALNVFNECMAPVEDMTDGITERLLTACIGGGAAAVRELIPAVAREVEERRDLEVDALMRRSDTGVEDVKKLVPQLDDTEELDRLAGAVTKYTRLLGSIVDRTRGRHIMTVGSHHPLHAHTGVLSEMEGHFDRVEAVRHERLEFFSAGHPFVRGLARGALQESTDRVAFVAREGVTAPAFVLHGRYRLPESFLEAVRNMPEDVQPAVLCSAGGNFGTRMAVLAVGFDGAVIEPSEESAALFEPSRKGDRSLDEGDEVCDWLPEDWTELCERVWETAEGKLKEAAAAYLGEGLPAFTGVLAEALARHFGSDFPVETQIDTLLYEMDPLATEIDAVMVMLPPKREATSSSGDAR